MTSIAQALRQASAQLQGSETPQLDAEVLLMHVLGKPRSHLHAWPEAKLDARLLQRFDALVAERIKGQPVAYLTGQREFWSLPLDVTEYTLIPRPDTELLVEQTLTLLPANQPLTVLDAGTGSGAIALALAHERPHWQIFATDRSPECLAVAHGNATKLDLCNVHFFTGHWCNAVADLSLDALVSNPPYVAEQDPHLTEGDVRFEPRRALGAGPHGLDDLKQLAAAATRVLKPSGYVLLEHGFDQAKAVRKLLKANKLYQVNSIRDLAGHERVSLARKSV